MSWEVLEVRLSQDVRLERILILQTILDVQSVRLSIG